MSDRAAAVPVFDQVERCPITASDGASVTDQGGTGPTVTHRPASDRRSPPRAVVERNAVARGAADAGIATGAHAWATGIDVVEARCLAARLAPDVGRLEEVVRRAHPALDADAVRDRALRLALCEIGAEVSRDTFTALRFDVDLARPVA